jgi:acetolactate synthase-1/2/3 large subunit
VHVHAGAEELGRVYTAELMLQASMACAAHALQGLDAPPKVAWADWAQAAHADYEGNFEAPPVAPLDLAVVMKTVQRLAPVDSLYTNGAGNYSGWLHRYVRYFGLQHHGRTQLAPTSGAMGAGLPYAVAASLLQPQRTAINLTGDGDFLMTGQELATATGYRAGRGAGKLVSIVVDNGTYGTIRMHQEREYPARVSGSDLFNPDFVALARAYDWEAHKVDATAQFEAAFATALASERPTLIHVKLDADVSTTRSTLSAMRAAALRRDS